MHKSAMAARATTAPQPQRPPGRPQPATTVLSVSSLQGLERRRACAFLQLTQELLRCLPAIGGAFSSTA